MQTRSEEDQKKQAHNYWNEQASMTQFSGEEEYAKEHVEDIEAYRYGIQPEVFSFAQFTRFSGKKVLDVGVGVGTDFLQWVRAGAKAYGIDYAPEAIEHVRRVLDIYGLEAEELKVADCTLLPYEDDSFDLVYSWGVLHHTLSVEKSVQEIVRVCRPGGTCKVMIYNRRSLVAFYYWVVYGLCRLKPWKSFAWCMYHHMESVGTEARTSEEIEALLSHLPVEGISIRPYLSTYDLLKKRNKLAQMFARVLTWFCGGDRVGLFMLVEFSKNQSS